MNRIIHQQITMRVRWVGSRGSSNSSSSSALRGSVWDSSGVPLGCVPGDPVFSFIAGKGTELSQRGPQEGDCAVRDALSYFTSIGSFTS